MNKRTYSVVLTPSIREALERAAQKERRSASSLLEKIIIDYLEREGISWNDTIPSKAGRPKKKTSRK